MDKGSEKSNFLSRNVSLIHPDNFRRAILGCCCGTRKVAAPYFHGEPSLMRFLIEVNSVIDCPNDYGINSFDKLCSTFNFVLGYTDGDILNDYIIGEECKSERTGWASFQVRNDFLHFVTRTQMSRLNFRQYGIDSSRAHPNVSCWRVSNVLQNIFESEINTVNIVKNWSSDLNINFYPRPIGGNESFLGNISGTPCKSNGFERMAALAYLATPSDNPQPGGRQGEDNSEQRQNSSEDRSPIFWTSDQEECRHFSGRQLRHWVDNWHWHSLRYFLARPQG